jgi:hypothetical protein
VDNGAGRFLALIGGWALFLALPAPAGAQPALGGTDWEADPDCIFDFLHLYQDGSSKLITFYDSGNENDPNEGKEIKLPGTWAFDGTTLSVKFSDFPDETLTGAFNGSDLEVTYSWRDKENSAHTNKCTLTQQTDS